MSRLVLWMLTTIVAVVLTLSIAPLAGASTPAAQGNDILQGEAVYPGQEIRSGNGRFNFTYQNDGNIVLYARILTGKLLPIWSSKTAGSSPGVLALQPDGNLVAYNVTGAPIWE